MNRNIYLIINLVLFVISVVSYNMPIEMDLKIILLEIIGFSSLFLFLFNKRSTGVKYFIQPVHVFLLAYMIVFFQRPIDYLIGLFSSSFFLGDIKLMPQCVFYADIGLIVFIAGYVIRRKFRFRQSVNYSIRPAMPTFFSYMTSLFILLMLIFVPRSVLMGGYGQELLGGPSSYNYFSSWVNIFIVAFLLQTILYYRSHKIGEEYNLLQFIKSLGWHQNVNLAIFALIILNVGDRGPLIVLALAYYMSFLIVSKKGIKKMVLIGMLIFAVLTVSFLGQTKSLRDNNSIFDRVSQAQESTTARQATSIAIATEELANSYQSLAYSIEKVNREKTYYNGQFQLSYFLGSFPFLGGLGQKVFGLPSTSSDIISKYIQGDDYDFGSGTSCLADLFLDGGLLFIIVGMFIWGVVLKYFEQRVLVGGTNSIFVLCVGFYFIIHTIYIPRSVILSPLKYSLWVFVIVWEYNVIMQKVKSRHGKEKAIYTEVT